jgi:prepilin peptidase CpaA
MLAEHMVQVLSNPIPMVSASVVTVAAAACDLKSRRIPNRLTGCSLLAGLVLHLCRGGLAEMGTSLMAFLLLYLSGGMGAGDVKLMAAVAGLAGLSCLRMVLIATVFSGVVFGLVIALYHHRFKQTVANALLLTSHHWRCGLRPHPDFNVRNCDESDGRALRMPFALPIAAGSLITLCLQIGRG